MIMWMACRPVIEKYTTKYIRTLFCVMPSEASSCGGLRINGKLMSPAQSTDPRNTVANLAVINDLGIPSDRRLELVRLLSQAWHLEQHYGHRVSRATVARHLTARGLVTPEPKKRPNAPAARVSRVSR